MPYFLLILLFCIGISTACPVYASGAETMATKLQQRYQSITSLQFSFEQQTMNAGRLRRGSGNGLFVRSTNTLKGQNNMSPITIMRWNYLAPHKQVILNTGKELSIYTEEDNQLIITSASEMESDITFALFSGRMNMLDIFSFSHSAATGLEKNSGESLTSITLHPKDPHPQIHSLRLWFSPDFIIEKLILEDHFGSTTTIVLKDITLDGLDPKNEDQLGAILDLSLPDDTEIIRQ